MVLVQNIYTFTGNLVINPDLAHKSATLSVSVCRTHDVTGRVFVNLRQGLAILEGQQDRVERYCNAVALDPLIDTMLLQSSVEIATPEFSEYSIWLNLPGYPIQGEGLQRLTPGTARYALPDRPSARLRIMAEAYLTEELLAV